MKELKRIVADIETVFSDSNYPPQFLADYDQMECLAGHRGRETFLVQNKQSGEMAVAKCYDRNIFPFEPDCSFLKEIDHPGIPRFYCQYQNEQMLCFVREYIEGEPLSTFAGKKQLSIGQILDITGQVCSLLEVLHTHNPPVIHRDIKPENIIVRPDRSVALIDFDISRTYKDGSESDTVFFGTKGYAAPEQYGFGQTDARTDIFAFGVLLRWLVTGSIRENRNIAIQPELQKIIDRCTAFSPDERFSSAGEIRKALSRAVTRKKRLSLKRLLILTAAFILGLCGGFAVGRCTDWLKTAPAIVFSEPLIEQAVRKQLDKERGSLSEEDLLKVKHLYIYGTESYQDPEMYILQTVDGSTSGPIRTLDDLALLPNLEELLLARQDYVVVSGIAGLAHLHSLELKHMRISGVQALAHVSVLRSVCLFDTGITDVTPFESCPWLETLDIGLNAISDLKHIGRHPNVRNLGLTWMYMDSLDGIADCFPNLQSVMLQHSDIKDLSGLLSVPGLKTVYVRTEEEEKVREALAGAPLEIRIHDI